MPPAAGRAVATGRPLETQVFPLNLASGTTGGGHARATTTDGLVSDTARRTDRSPAKSGGPDRHSSQRCVVGSQHLLTKRCVVGPHLGEGAQSVFPPSRHKFGNRYRWVPGRGPGETELAPMPPWLLQLWGASKGVGAALVKGQAKALAEGERVKEGRRD